MERRTFLKIVSSAGIISLISPAFAAEICKNKASVSSSTFLESAFRNPPFSSGVYTWWHWMNGNITKEGITRDLEAMKANGIAGYQLFEAGSGIPIGPVESISNEWIELVLHTLKESERLGLEFAMHNCPGWSSSGGPWITPDKAMQKVTWSETRLTGGKQIRMQLPTPKHMFDYYVDTYCLAVPADKEIIPKSSVIELSNQLDKNGFLIWDAPVGDWLIMRFGQTARDQKNKSAPSKSTGLECDKFSIEALDYHLDCMFKRLMPTMEKIAKRSKIGLLIDSYETGDQDWTRDMPVYFEQRRGYALIPFLPVLANKVIESEKVTQRFQFDFRRTKADMFADRYYSHFQKRCKEQGIITYTEPYGGNMIEELQVAQRLDINMGEFWCNQTMLWANYRYNRTVKQVASIAHTLGGKVVGAEAFTSEPDADKWLLYPYALKSLGDYMFTRGLSRIYFHRYAHQPHPTAAPGMTMGPWGLHFDRTNTWWKPGKAWINYLNRCQHIFQSSTFYGDILYHSGDDSFGATIEPEQTLLAPPEGYDYDQINTEILEKACIKNGKIILPATGFDGYKLLVLLKSETMSLRTLQLLAQLVEKGMVLVGQKPQHTLGLIDGEKESEFNALVRQIWQHPNVHEGNDLHSILHQLNISPDFIYHSITGSSAVHAIHYQQNETEIYFIANRKRMYEKGTAHFRIKGYIPELWNPYTAEILQCPVYKTDKEGIEIPLNLAPAESMFVVFRKADKQQAWTAMKYNGTPLFPTTDNCSTKSPLATNFSITFWIKPEADIAITEEQEHGEMRTRFFAIYPQNGEQRYGKGHSTVGLSVGRNGIVVYERTVNNKAVYRHAMPLSGWTHFALIYKNNTPNLWINGECIGVGKTSDTIVHLDTNGSDPLSKADTYEGGLCNFNTYSFAIGETDIISLYQKGVPSPLQENEHILSWLPNHQFVAWKAGVYEFVTERTILQKYIDILPASIPLEGPWTVRFPQNMGAPDEITLNGLHSLHLENDFGVRHFSGTMVYLYSLSLSSIYLQDNLCLRLDLGRVEVIAEVLVNGKCAGICWAPPYTIDIQQLLCDGDNTIEVRVTNLWVNRLIGDEYLPEENTYNFQPVSDKYSASRNGGIKKLPEWYVHGKPKPAGGRIAFTTWKHYDKTSPLVESGLLGPVVLTVGKIESIKMSEEDVL